MIVFDNVRFKYPYDDFELLKGVSFSFEKGVNTLLADTQSGKSTAAKLLCRLIEPSGGNITADEKPISSITRDNLGILYLSDKPVFFERRSVLYNAAYPLKTRGIPKAERLAIAKEILSRFGFGNFDTKVRDLNSEERKKLSLARGLTVERKTVLFDDFFDKNAAEEYVEETLDMFRCETKILFTSNAALARGNTVILDGGSVVFTGSAENARKYKESLSWIYDIE